MPDFDRVIRKCDEGIRELIGRMVKARLKRIDASSRVLDVLGRELGGLKFKARLGSLYEPFIRAERAGFKLDDLERPVYSLEYGVSRGSLQYDGKTVEIPEIPDFIIETWTPTEPIFDPDTLKIQVGEEYFKHNVLIRFPIDVDIEETPSFENAWWKFYRFDIYDQFKDENDYTIENPPKIFLITQVMEPTEIHSEYAVWMQRTLTVEGEWRTVVFRVWSARIRFRVYFMGATDFVPMEDVELPALWGEMVADTDKLDSVVFMGRELHTIQQTDNNWWGNILVAMTNEQAIMHVGAYLKTITVVTAPKPVDVAGVLQEA